MADASRDRYHGGLLIPDPRVTFDTIWAAESSYQQAEPRPGVPEPASSPDTDLVLEASGTQSADKTLQVRTLKGSHSGGDAGGYCWRYSGDDNWRGHNVPNAIWGFEALAWTDGTANPYSTDQLDTITLANGDVLVAYREQTDNGTPTYAVSVYRLDSSAMTWSTVEVFTADDSEDRYPCMVELPSGRVLLYHWVVENNQRNVRVHYSDDYGDTWTVGQLFCLSTEISDDASTGYEARRLRAAYLNGQILLIAATEYNGSFSQSPDTLFQYASDDLGMTFDYITETETNGNAPDAGKIFDLVEVGERFLVVFINTAARTIESIHLGSAYQSITEATATVINSAFDSDNTWDTELRYGELDGGSSVTGDLAICVDEDGAVYLYGTLRDNGTGEGAPHEGWMLRSADNGETWDPMGKSSFSHPTGGAPTSAAMWIHPANSQDGYPKGFSVTAAHGRIIMATNWEPEAGSNGDSLVLLYLGGYSTVTMPGHQGYPLATERVSWEQVYLPFDVPGTDNNWTASTTGTASQTLKEERLEIATTAGTVSNVDAFSGTAAEGLIAYFSLRTSGGQLSQTDCGVSMTLNNGANDRQIEIRFTPTGYRVADTGSGAASTIGDVSGLMLTSRYEFLVVFTLAGVRVWHRLWTRDGDMEWVEGPSGGSLNSSAISGSNDFRWGHLTSSTVTSDWYMVASTFDEYTGLQIDPVAGQANPTELFWRHYATTPQWVNDGVRIAAVDGPSIRGDQHTISTRYEYPLADALPGVAPSPRRPWRTTGNTQQTVAWDLVSGVSERAWTLGDTIGVYLGSINWSQGELQGYNGSSWATIATIDTRITSLPYTRRGNTLRCSATTHSIDRYFHLDELVGGTVDLGSGDLRKIVANTEGYWTDATTKQMTIQFEGQDGTEASSGTMSIWPPNATILAHTADGYYEGLRLQIDAHTTVDGYFETGALLIGWVAYWGWDPSHGRTLSRRPNVELRERDDGTRTSRKRGPSRREVTLAWTGGVDHTKVDAGTDDYVLGTATSGAEPVALRHDIAYKALGLLEHLDGPNTLLVYLPRIDKGTPDTLTLTDPGQVYGRLVSDVQVESILGDEHENEVYVVSPLVISEEV